MKNIARYSSLLAVTTLSLVGVAGLAGCDGGDEVVEVERRQVNPDTPKVDPNAMPGGGGMESSEG